MAGRDPLEREQVVISDAEIAAARVDAPPDRPLAVVAADPGWPAAFARLETRVRAALGARVLGLQHVGSTAVPGLPAKDVVDADLLVADTRDEDAYVPDLVAAGFRLTIREEDWDGHRMLVGADPESNLHVWSADSGEPVRHRLFRDWLRTHPEDRDAYAAAKRAAVGAPGVDGEVHRYNNAKGPAIQAILDRMFAARRDGRDPD